MNVSSLLRFLLRDYCLFAVGDEDDPEQDDDSEQDGDADPDPDADPEDEADPGGEADPDADPDVDPDAEGEPEAEGELSISLGGEEQPPEDEREAKPWVKELRKRNRDMVRAMREKDEEIARLKGGTAQPVVQTLGAKPTLEGCDYDAEKFEKDLDAWHALRTKIDEQKRAKEDEESKGREAWQRTQDAYTAAKKALKVSNFEDAELAVEEALSVQQRGMLLDALSPKQAAVMVYALGNSPKALKDLAAVSNPIKYIAAVKDLEHKELKVIKNNKAKTAPAPERVPRGSVASGGAIDNQVDRLRKEAQQTGDYSKVMEFRRQQDAKKRKRA